MRSIVIALVIATVCLFVLGNPPAFAQSNLPGVIYKDGPVISNMIDAGFHYGDSNYNGIIHASDGNVYYVICSHNKKSGAHVFKYNPRSRAIFAVGDLTELVGEDRTKVINQGKVHCDFYELDGKLYFGTHAGAYDRTYPGGHFMSYDLKTEKFEDFGIGTPNEGLVALTMDTKRKRMYAVTWPGYTFLYYDNKTKKVERWKEAIAPVIQQGPRSLGVDPRTGNVYWHNMNETIYCYNYENDKVETLKEPKFDTDMFKIPTTPSVENVWRSIKWSDALQKFYGVMYNSDWLFSFEPKSAEIEIIDRITSAPNRKSGKTIYSSLAFEFSRDGKTVYYIAHTLTENPDGTDGETELHLVTYDIPMRRYIDHGPIELTDGRRPRYCQGLEVGTNGKLYIVAWIKMTDTSTDKFKEKLKISTGGKPALEIEQSKNLQEINLIEIPVPLN